MQQEEVGNHNKLMKPHDMHPEDSAISIMMELHNASAIYNNNTETNL